MRILSSSSSISLRATGRGGDIGAASLATSSSVPQSAAVGQSGLRSGGAAFAPARRLQAPPSSFTRSAAGWSTSTFDTGVEEEEERGEEWLKSEAADSKLAGMMSLSLLSSIGNETSNGEVYREIGERVEVRGGDIILFKERDDYSSHI